MDNNKDRSVVIVQAKRTPIGDFMGILSPYSAPELASFVIKDILKESDLKPDQVQHLILGQVLTAGVGQAPVRQAAIKAGLPTSVPCIGVSKVCGSGMQSLILATQMIQLNEADIVLAGGMESMSQAPYLLDKARKGYRLGNQTLIDSLIHDGLWDHFNQHHMGHAAELCANTYKISREDQDKETIQSYQKALNAQKHGYFKSEIVSITINDDTLMSEDEAPKKFNKEKTSSLKPVFDKEGSVTVANSSSLNDGASVCLLMSLDKANQLGLKPLAKVIRYAGAAMDPEWFTIAPASAMETVLSKTKMTTSDIDLYEINEAFAVVSIVNKTKLKLDSTKVNVHGGAVALGHPIGASGTRIVTTLTHALHHQQKKRGLASICIGGGEALSLIIEAIY